jgi:hypothetical protein
MFPAVATDNRGYTVIRKTFGAMYAGGKVVRRRVEEGNKEPPVIKVALSFV